MTFQALSSSVFIQKYFLCVALMDKKGECVWGQEEARQKVMGTFEPSAKFMRWARAASGGEKGAQQLLQGRQPQRPLGANYIKFIEAMSCCCQFLPGIATINNPLQSTLSWQLIPLREIFDPHDYLQSIYNLCK